MRSLHWSEKIEELVTELEGYRWDAILLSETWRHEPAELWETHHNHIFMGAGRYENKHGVGIMLNKRCAIKTTILVNRQHIDLMSVYFPHSKHADHHIEKMYITIEKHMTNNKKCIPIVGGDFNAELGPGKGAEAESTLVDTVVHETEDSTTMRCSEADNLRGGFAHLEHRRPDGWTSTPRRKDEKHCSEHDETRSQPFARIGGERDAHDTITFTGCSSSCDLRAGERLPKQRPLGDEHPERIPEEHLGAQNDSPGRKGRFYRVTIRSKPERVQERKHGNARDHVCCSKEER